MMWLSLFTLYRVTNRVTHGFWESAGAGKGGWTGRFFQNAQDFGDLWGRGGRNKYFCGGVGFEVSALKRTHSRRGGPSPGPRLAQLRHA